jgi:hypothetical protein
MHYFNYYAVTELHMYSILIIRLSEEVEALTERLIELEQYNTRCGDLTYTI